MPFRPADVAVSEYLCAAHLGPRASGLDSGKALRCSQCGINARAIRLWNASRRRSPCSCKDQTWTIASPRLNSLANSTLTSALSGGSFVPSSANWWHLKPGGILMKNRLSGPVHIFRAPDRKDEAGETIQARGSTGVCRLAPTCTGCDEMCQRRLGGGVAAFEFV